MEWSFDVATALGLFGGLWVFWKYRQEQRLLKKQQIQRVVISWVYVGNDDNGQYALRVSNYSDTAILDLQVTSRVETKGGSVQERKYYYPVIHPGDFLLEYDRICTVRAIDIATDQVNVLQRSDKHGFKAKCQDIDRVNWETCLPMKEEYFMRPWKEIS